MFLYISNKYMENVILKIMYVMIVIKIIKNIEIYLINDLKIFMDKSMFLKFKSIFKEIK